MNKVKFFAIAVFLMMTAAGNSSFADSKRAVELAKNVRKIYLKHQNYITMAASLDYVGVIDSNSNNNLILTMYKISDDSFKKDGTFLISKNPVLLGKQPLFIQGNTAVVGVLSSADNSGRVMFLRRNNENWKEDGSFKGNNYFGSTVTLRDNKAIISAGKNSTKAYIFEKQNNKWTEVKELTSLDPTWNIFCGDNSTIAGDFAFVPGENKKVRNSKAMYVNHNVYIFEKVSDKEWIRVGFLKNPNPERYTYSKSISGFDNYVAVTVLDHKTKSNAILIFKRNGEEWEYINKVVNSDLNFGSSVSLFKDKLIVGSVNDKSNTGILYIYINRNDKWILAAELKVKFKNSKNNNKYDCRKIVI